MTVLMVTHNEALAAMGDVVVRLRSGEVVEVSEGTGARPEEVAV